jgi:outer membrane protein TolC
MESGPAVSQPDAATLIVVKGAVGGKLAETTARCHAAIAAAEASLQRAQAALAVAQERLRRAWEAEVRFRERRTSRMPAALAPPPAQSGLRFMIP